VVVFFFFQAEDGIRDFHVTGVQTCALPISPRPRGAGALAVRPMGRRAMDEHDGLHGGHVVDVAPRWLGAQRAGGGRAFCQAWPDRSGSPGTDPPPGRLLPGPGALHAGALYAAAAWRRGGDRRATLAGDRGVRARARAPVAVQSEPCHADLGRHGLAAHLHEYQRVRLRTRCQPAAAVFEFAGSLQPFARGYAGAALAWAAFPWLARAHRTAAPASCG